MSNSKRTVVLFNPACLKKIGEFTLPMGLMLTAIHLYEKFRVVIVDQMIENHWEWKSKLSALLDERPVCIGITAMTGKQIKEGLRVSEIARDKGCPVVWGGIHASLLPAQTCAHPLVDYVVEGEGEESFAELVEALASGRSCAGIPGVWHKENGEPASGGQREFLKVNELPPIPYHLVDVAEYIQPGPFGKSLVFYSSRGCPQRCAFCFNYRINRFRWRPFSSDRVLEDIRRIRAEHPDIRHVQFWDDNFFASLKRAREIGEGIQQMRPALTWSCLGTHVRDVMRMDDEYLGCMRDTGLKEVVVGAESGSQSIIDMVRKNFLVEELLESNKRLGDFGIRPTYSFISGVLGADDEEHIKKTVEVMFKLKKDNAHAVLGSIKPLIYYPGTELYGKAVDMGFSPPQHLEEWSDFVWNNYMDLKFPWFSTQRQRQLNYLYYYTLLMSPNYAFIKSRLFRFVATILRPFAEWRVKRLCFRLPLAAWGMHLFQRYCV